MMKYTFHETLDDAVADYAESYPPDVNDDRSFWLHETYIDVFPTDAIDRIKIEIADIRAKVIHQLAYDIAFDAVRTFEHSWRKPYQNTVDQLSEETIEDVTISIAAFVMSKIGDDTVVQAIKVRIPAILRKAENFTTSAILDIIQNALEEHYKGQDRLFEELPIASENNPVNSFVESLIIKHAYLRRMLKKANRTPREARNLEPYIVEELRLIGSSPIDFLRSDDISVRSRIREKAIERQKDSKALPSLTREVIVPSSFELPEFLVCSPEEWIMLMNTIEAAYIEQKRKFLWKPSWRLARIFIDECFARTGIMREGKTNKLPYSAIFMDLFWKDCDFIADSKKVAHNLSRTASPKRLPGDPDYTIILKKIFAQ